MAENSILGIDLRVRSIKLVELQRQGKDFVVTAWGFDTIPEEVMEKHPEKEIAQGRALSNLIKIHNIKTKNAIAVIGGQDVYITQLYLPPLSRDETRKAIKWKLQEELPFLLEEAIVDFMQVGAPEKGAIEVCLTVAVVRKKIVEDLLKVCKLAGLNLVSIIPVPIALKQIFLDRFVPGEITCAIYMGRMTTNIAFFKGADLEFSREIPLGGEDITKAMTSVLVSEEGRLELKYDEAEKIKTEYGVPMDLENYPKLQEIPVAHLQAVVRPALEKISAEILRTIDFYRSQAGELAVKKILFTGGSSKTPHLPEFLSSTLEVPVEVPDVFTRANIFDKMADQEKLARFAPQMAGAVGAALDFFEKDINLLPEEIREKLKFLIKKHAQPRKVAVLLVSFLILVWAGTYLYMEQAKKNVIALENRITELKPKIDQLEVIERAVKEEEGRAGIFQSIQNEKLDIPTVMEDLSDSMPPEVMIDRLTILGAEKQMDFNGSVFGKGDTPENILSRFVLSLSKEPSFEKVDLISATKGSGFIYDSFTFQVTAKLKKP